jgi:hypothetical protein
MILWPSVHEFSAIGHKLNCISLLDFKFAFSKWDINPLKTKRRLLYLKTQFVPRSKHFSSRL